MKLKQCLMIKRVKQISCTCFGSSYTKIGTIQRLARPLSNDDTEIHETFHIFQQGNCIGRQKARKPSRTQIVAQCEEWVWEEKKDIEYIGKCILRKVYSSTQKNKSEIILKSLQRTSSEPLIMLSS